MMSVVKISSFSFRDILQYIIPTTTAVILFSPFFSILNLEVLVASTIVLSYAVAPFVSDTVTICYKFIPGIKKKYNTIQTTREYWARNWDFEAVFYKLKQDERDYLYITGAYVELYKCLSFYFLLYALTQAYMIVSTVIKKAPVCELDYVYFWQANTPLVGGWRLPSCVLLLFSFLIFITMSKAYFLEFEILFGSDGVYNRLAENINTENSTYVKSVWGVVTYHEKPAANAKVALLFIKNNEEVKVKTDSHGRFQFTDYFSQCKNNSCSIKIEYKDWSESKEITLKNEGSIPCFDFIMN